MLQPPPSPRPSSSPPKPKAPSASPPPYLPPPSMPSNGDPSPAEDSRASSPPRPPLSQRTRRSSGGFLLFPPRNRRHVPSAIRFRGAFRQVSRLFRLLGPFCFLGLMALGLHGLGGLLTRSKTFTLREIQCPDHPSLPRSLILSLIEAKPGISLLAYDLKQAAQRLRKQPQIKTFQIRRIWPDRLSIDLSIHPPVAVLFLDHPYLVDQEGRIFARALPGISLQGLLRLRGLQRSDLEKKPAIWQPLLRQALSLGKEYDQLGLSTFLPIQEIQIDPVLGYTLKGPLGETILLGSTHLHTRLRRLDEVFQLLSKSPKRKIAYIHLNQTRNPQRVFLKLAEMTPARQENAPNPQR